MKLKTLVLVILTTLILTGCGANKQGNENTSKVLPSNSMSGTYIGKNGSVLILFPDGSSEYYYLKDTDLDDGAGNWSYQKGKLDWTYSGCTLSATIDSQVTQTFAFDTVYGSWIHEEYFKVSDTAEVKTVKQCRELLRKALNRPEMDNFRGELNQTVTVGNFTVEVPFYMSLSETDASLTSKMFYAEDNEADKCCAFFYFEVDKLNVSNEQFQQQGVWAWNNLFENLSEAIDGCVITKEPAPMTVNGYAGFEGAWQFDEDGYKGNVTLAIINDADSGNTLLLLQTRTDNTIFRYDSDFKKIVDSITIVDDNIDSNGNVSDPTSSNNSGITPELKAFLDRYETFMDKYIAFMQKYQNSSNSSAMLTDYLSMMQEYAEFTEAINKYDTNEMSTADSMYYLEVTTRVAKKLINVAG